MDRVRGDRKSRPNKKINSRYNLVVIKTLPTFAPENEDRNLKSSSEDMIINN
jgi:hypothetical protein